MVLSITYSNTSQADGIPKLFNAKRTRNHFVASHLLVTMKEHYLINKHQYLIMLLFLKNEIPSNVFRRDLHAENRF